jgi:hypothetical protein
MFKHLLAACVATFLASCASLPELGTRLVVGTATVPLAANSPLKESLEVNNVSDGKGTTSYLSSGAVRLLPQALQITLSAEGMLAAAGGQRSLDAVVLDVKEPLSLDTTIISTVRYVVTDVATGRVTFDQTIVADYTVKLVDQPLGYYRLRNAFDGSIKNNISKFLDQLIATPGDSGSQGEPPGSNRGTSRIAERPASRVGPTICASRSLVCHLRVVE